MICPDCANSARPGFVIIGSVFGWLAIAGYRVPAWVPCPTCCGSKISYCCDTAGSEDRAAKTPASKKEP